ncbi:hypothetical protein BC826DRAFT_1031116, partial [Russula brevipes]
TTVPCPAVLLFNLASVPRAVHVHVGEIRLGSDIIACFSQAAHPCPPLITDCIVRWSSQRKSRSEVDTRQAMTQVERHTSPESEVPIVVGRGIIHQISSCNTTRYPTLGNELRGTIVHKNV